MARQNCRQPPASFPVLATRGASYRCSCREQNCFRLVSEAWPKESEAAHEPQNRIGAKEFECIGQSPPQDHPHVFLEMGSQNEILCPYCSTLFRFDLSLAALESNPAESLFRP